MYANEKGISNLPGANSGVVCKEMEHEAHSSATEIEELEGQNSLQLLGINGSTSIHICFPEEVDYIRLCAWRKACIVLVPRVA